MVKTKALVVVVLLSLSFGADLGRAATTAQEPNTGKQSFDVGMRLAFVLGALFNGSESEVRQLHRLAVLSAAALDLDIPFPPLGDKSTARAAEGIMYAIDTASSIDSYLRKVYGARAGSAFMFAFSVLAARILREDEGAMNQLLSTAADNVPSLGISNRFARDLFRDVREGRTDDMLSKLSEIRSVL